MANKRISELEEALNLQDSDLLVIVQNSATKKITVLKAKDLLKGKDGINGKDGKDGSPGPVNTITIGTVTKGEVASATLTGNPPNQVLNLVLPKGDDGEKGKEGISIATITNGESTQDEEYTITPLTIKLSDNTEISLNIKAKNGVDGTVSFNNLTEEQKLELKGEKGDTGAQGEKGETGDVGPQGPKGETGLAGESINCIKVDDEQTALTQSASNPNNIYYW